MHDSTAALSVLPTSDTDDRAARRRLEAELASERAAHRALLAASSDAVFDLEPSGRIVDCGGKASALTGLPRAQLLGLKFSQLFLEREEDRAGVLLVFAMGAPQRAALALKGVHGARSCAVAVQAFTSSSGRLNLRAVLEDTSAHEQIEQEQRRAAELAAHSERLATIGQLAAGVAHEINNPLAFIKSNLTTLADEVALLKLGDAELQADLAQMVAESLEGTERIRRIVEALRGTARQKTNESVSFDAGKVVSEATTVFRGAHRAVCTVGETLEPLLHAQGSPGALGQVLLNLLQNGLDAMGGKGALEVTARRQGGAVVLCVTDHGTGIPPEVQPKVFDPFFTTKPSGVGTGLGLYICKRMMTEMRGALTFSTSAEGTTFTVTLPASTPGGSA